MDYTLEEYITIEAFNNMVLVERIEAINNLLKKFDIKRINKHLGFDVEILFWCFGYKLDYEKFIPK